MPYDRDESLQNGTAVKVTEANSFDRGFDTTAVYYIHDYDSWDNTYWLDKSPNPYDEDENDALWAYHYHIEPVEAKEEATGYKVGDLVKFAAWNNGDAMEVRAPEEDGQYWVRRVGGSTSHFTVLAREIEPYVAPVPVWEVDKTYTQGPSDTQYTVTHVDEDGDALVSYKIWSVPAKAVFKAGTRDKYTEV